MPGGFLSRIFGGLSSTTTEYTAEAIDAQLTAFRTALIDGSAANTAVRLWVDSGASYGHQSSTVNIMYRFARPHAGLNFGYTGTIEIYYESDDDLSKLYDLIPEMQGNPTDRPVGRATVSLIKYSGQPPEKTVNFGLTGGVNKAGDALATKLNVSYFLRLQPYNWSGQEDLQFKDGRESINLLTLPEVGGARFKRRLFFLEPTLYQNPPWQSFLGTADPVKKVKVEIVQHLVSDDFLGNFQLQAVYSIKSLVSRLNVNPTFGAALVSASALEWQQNGNFAGAKPVVIVNFDDFGTSAKSEEDGLQEVLAGGFGPGEEQFKGMVEVNKIPDAILNYKNRQTYFQGLDTANRFHYLNYPATLKVVTDKLAELDGAKNAVLFIQLGRTFNAVFSNAQYMSTLPPLFEGQNSANEAVNMGRPFMQIPAPDQTESNKLGVYPSFTMVEFSTQQVPQALISVASQIASSPQVWPANANSAPSRIVGNYYQQYSKERPTDTIHKYFAKVKEFFAGPEEDKLSVALAYLNTQVSTNELVASDAADDPLPGLYDKIAAAITAGGAIDLVPGILTEGRIPGFVASFLKDLSVGLNVSGGKLNPASKPAKPAEFTLSGSTDAFEKIGVPADISIRFTAPDGKLVSDFAFTVTEQWTIPDAPWMVFERPYVEFTIADSMLPVSATIGGHVGALESGAITAKLQIAIGGAKDYWSAGVAFEGGYPGIATVYQLVTGVNILGSLPAPFNVVADLGLSDVLVEYDYAESVVDSVAIVAKSNTPNLKLFGKLVLDNVVVTTVVVNPTTTRTVLFGVSAEFGLGSSAVVTVSFNYPDVVLQGALTSGTPTFTDLLDSFGVPVIELPHQPTLDAFAFMYNQSTDYLSASAELTMPDWDFQFDGKSLFALKSVSFAVVRDKGTNTGNITAKTEILSIGVDIGGYALANGDLKFEAKTTSAIDIKALIDEYLGTGWVPDGINLPTIESVSVELVWGKDVGADSSAKSFQFAAKTAPWSPIEALGDDLTAAFDLNIGYEPAEAKPEVPAASAVIEATVVGEPPSSVALAAMGAAEKKPWKGNLTADVTLWFIHLKVEYDFDPEVQKVCVTWTDVGLKACVEEVPDKTDPKKKDTVATFSLEDQTIGSMIEKFVSWATGTQFGLMAPFSVLNDISLSGLKVTYNFTQKKVDFTVDIGPIDLGLFTIKGITLAYNPDGNPNADGTKSTDKVAITVNGSFLWQDGDDLSWAPDNPSTTPAPPGGGSKYFDLRLLALGQHVTVDGLVEAKSVEEIIDKLEKLEIPKLPGIPVGGPGQVKFAPESSWFVAFDFGILKVEKKKEGEAASASAAIPASTGDAGSIEPVRAAAALADGEEGPDQYFISLAIVFNDPYVYGLRISLDGPLAKVFAGLDFQIMYQQVSKNVGKYSAQIALPTIMRRFQIGVASITLPVFGIEIYTNGDFQVDIGFPWKEDFSRSFQVEFQAGPFPVTGAAGFYFGKLSSATTNKVPAHKNPGWFNPVIVFGFGARVGLGKSIDAGILKAGFSVTVFGIIEGVIARWQPYKEITTGGDKNQLQDGYFFSITGTVGLQGRLYGSINFAIISAELDVQISLYVRITFASYEPIPITAKARVSVTLTVKINLGLFKISIHLSFKASIEVTFVLDNPMGSPDDAPWNKPPPEVVGAQAAPALSNAGSATARLRARGLAKATGGALAATSGELFAMAARADSYTPTWTNLLPGTGLRVNGWVVPVLSIAGDMAFGTTDGHSDPAKNDPSKQVASYVLNFFVEGANPTTVSAHSAGATGAHAVAPEHLAQVAFDRARTERLVAASAEAYTNTFEDLAVRVLQWVIAAGKDGQHDPAGVDGLFVSTDFLEAALAYLSGSGGPVPVDSTAIEQFLAGQAKFLFNLETADKSDPATAVFFPAAPGLRLQAPKGKDWGPFDYKFGGYNSTSSTYLTDLNTYFNELKVQVQQEDEHDNPQAAAAPTYDSPSVGAYIFGDYFAMIGRITVQSMLDGLRNFKLPLADHAGATVDQIVEYINAKIGPSTADKYTTGELLVANAKHALRVGAALSIQAMQWRSPGGKSLQAIATEPVFKASFDAIALGLENAANATIIAAGTSLTHDEKTYVTQSADTLNKIASALGFGTEKAPDVRLMLTQMPDLQTLDKLLAAQSILHIPTFTHNVVDDGTTLQAVAARYGLTVDLLVAPNGGATDLFACDAPKHDPNLDVPYLPSFEVAALIDEMKRTLALQHSAAMASRYYLHGLRLPTSFGDVDGMVANADGLFVNKGGKYPADMGLFGLTGQAFALPENIPAPTPGGDAPYAFTVSTTDEAWLSLEADGQKSVTFTMSETADYDRYYAVQAAAAGYLDTGSTDVQPIEVGAATASRYPLSTEIPWQPAVEVTLPRQAIAPTTPRPRLWQLPNELVNVPDGSVIRPTIAPVVARSDEATGTTVDEPVANFGFGTLVTFNVRRVDTATDGIMTRTYEIIGAPESEITLLERLLHQLQDDTSSFDRIELFYRPASTSSEVAGWQSDDPKSTLMGLSKTNLSTETGPPTGGVQAMAAADFTNLIGTPNEFIRLLWEASITRSGGFYLNYNTGIPAHVKGLPDHAFNDKGEAELAVFALFVHGSVNGQELANFMNVAATNESFDLSNAALVAETVEVLVATPRVFRPDDTLRSYAAAYYAGPGVLAEQNAAQDFSATAGVEVVVEGGVYQVPPNPTQATPTVAAPYGDLSLIAQHFNTDPAAINAVNAGNPLPQTISAYTAIKLPAVTVAASGQSFEALSRYYGAPVAELAAANYDVAGLFDAALTVSTGPTSLAPTVDRGIAGMTLHRSVPSVPDTPTGDWGTQYLLQNFSMLAYLVSQHAENAYFKASNWGLPSGPIEPDTADGDDKIQAPKANADGWDFRFAIPYSKLLNAGPFGGVGGILQFEIAWLDIFGNRMLTELDNPAPPTGTPLQGQPQLPGYTDRLVGVGQWPAVANAYRVTGTGDPTLTLELDFDPTSYVAAAKAIAAGLEPAKTAGEQTLGRAIASYTIITEQLNDPNHVTIELATSMVPSKTWSPSESSTPAELTAWTASILSFLEQLQTNPNAVAPEGVAFSVSLANETINADQIFTLETTISLKRKASLVAGELATVAGVATAQTMVAPWTGSLTTNVEASNSDTNIQRDLTAFAKDFTAAFGTTADRSFRIATGPDRTVFTGSGRGPLWVVQLGTSGSTEPLSYSILDVESVEGPPAKLVGDPTVYAPRPISNTLRSRKVTPIIPYDPGTPLDPDGPVDNRSFADIDLDKWMTTTLGYIDELLTPKFVVPAEILRSKTGNNALQTVLDAKEKLAANLADVMTAVYVGEHPVDEQIKDIREAFRQTMLATMGGFYTVKAGIQFEAAVKAAIKRPADSRKVPRIYGDIRLKPLEGDLAGTAAKTVSVSSPKLDLQFAPDGPNAPPLQSPIPAPSPYLSALVSSTSVEAKNVVLNLDYDGQYIEHQIGVVDGIPGYQPSSWLSFVDIDDPPAPGEHKDTPLGAELGQFDVPIVLRAFPTTPTLVNQDNVIALTSACHQPIDDDTHGASGPLLSGLQCATPGDYDPLATATRWNYSFSYSLQHHSEQDEIHGSVSFNIQEGAALLAAAARARDIFDNLAQFTQIYPAIRDDLNQYLAPVDIGSVLGPDLTKAEAALQSAATMIHLLAKSPPSLPPQDDDELMASAAPASVDFVISEVGVPKGEVTALQVTVTLAAALPARVGVPLLEIAGWNCERQTNDPADPLKGVFLYTNDSGEYLDASKGANIAARTFVLPDLDILERQDAQSKIYITRNADLVPGKQIAPEFIYQTPTVSFERPLHPTISNDDPIDLATIYSTDVKDPVTRSLDCQLSVLYQALFANAGTTDVTLQTSLYYEYEINSTIERIRLPVYLMPPTKTKLSDGGAGTPLADVVELQAGGWRSWMAANTPNTAGARLTLDLTVMSDLTAKPMPILHLSELFVAYTELD